MLFFEAFWLRQEDNRPFVKLRHRTLGVRRAAQMECFCSEKQGRSRHLCLVTAKGEMMEAVLLLASTPFGSSSPLVNHCRDVGSLSFLLRCRILYVAPK